GRLWRFLRFRHLRLQLLQTECAAVAALVTQEDAFPPDIHRDHLFPADGRHQGAALAREPLARLDVRIVLVGETAHETPAAAGDLRRIQRQALVLGQLEAHRLQLAQPRGAAEFSPAPAHAAQRRCLVPYTDLLQLDARAERAREVADQLAEIDAPLGRE